MRNVNDTDDIRKTFQARQNTNKDYMVEYVIGSQRNVLYNLANAIHAIENDDVLMDLFHFNLATNREMLKVNNGLVPVNDRVAIECREYLQRHCGLRAIKKHDVEEAIHVVARRNTYDTLMEWLNSLVHDGIPRADTWLIECFGVEDTDYTRKVSAMSLMAMVKRALRPGCKSDYMLILEGLQGPGKSECIKALAGGEQRGFYSENLPQLDYNGGKDASIHVLGYWIIEISEMHSMLTTKVDVAQVKSFISRAYERFRPVHGRRDEQTPRRCFFIGTTNKREYLRDETGNRRMWPVWCKKADLDWIKTNRDQLLAEAIQRVRDGEHTYPTPEEERQWFRIEQDKRQEVDELFNLMKDFCGSMLTPETTATHVWRGITGRSDAIPDDRTAKRMAPLFRALGYERAKSNGRMVWRKD